MKSRIASVLLLMACVFSGGIAAQTSGDLDTTAPGAASVGKPTSATMHRAGSTAIDLRRLPSTPPKKRDRPEREEPDVVPVPVPGTNPSTAIPSTGVPGPSAPAPSTVANFLGLDFAAWGAGRPPDTNGDVGPTYYIETVNTSIGIYRKSDSVQVAAFTFDTFMSQGNFGNLCDTDNFGDPVVLYDTFEDRWVITDFAFQLDGSGNVINPPGTFQCFAVSKTGDPVTGGWNFYSLHITDALNDYPKFGIWPDGIYMSANMFAFPAGGAFQGTRVWALNKAQMYAGTPNIQVVQFSPPSGEFTLLPSNARLETGTPPTGSPNYFSTVFNFTNAVSTYQFHVDWNSISLSTLTGPFITIAPASWVTAPATVPAQGGNANDTLATRLMMQNQYTNLGGTESLWVAHTVRNPSTAGVSAPRYYQTTVTGGTVAASTTQAFTHAPDTTSRYMPSVAVDRAGDMAIGYSASSATLAPAIRYAGRLGSDGANSLPQTEASLVEGTGAQNTSTRWGDYSAMTLDPDGCTFWYSNEYYITTGNNWQTRIGSFAFPSCTPAANGTVAGTVTAAAGGAPIVGATVALGSRTTLTDGSGFYQFALIASGTYPSITASCPGFDSSTINNVVVTDGATTTEDFSLNAAANAACLTDTTQADMQTGIPTNVDLTSSPGDVILLNAPTIDQQNTNLSGSGVVLNVTTWGGQTFTAATTGQLVKADINLFCSSCTGTAPNLTLSVRATSGNLPTGADIASATLTGNNSGASSYFTGTFATPPVLTAGTVYALVVRPITNPSAGTYAVTRSATNVYSGGQRVSSTDSGTTWTAPLTAGQTTDAGFRTYMKTGFALSGDLISSVKDANPAVGFTTNWSTLSWTATIPANTSVKFQAAASNSATGPFNFVGPDGTASTFFTTSGASLSEFNGNRYLKYRAYLSTTDSSVTPTVSDVTVCFTDPCIPPPTPTVTPGGTTTFCAGGSVTLTSTSATGNQWSLSSTPIGGATAQQYIATASGDYTDVITNDNGCMSAPSAVTTVTVNPLPATPTITPGGPTTFCAGGSVTLTSSSATGNQWYLDGNPIGGATDQTYVATASGNYTVQVTDGNSCVSTASAATTVTVNPIPATPTITPEGPTTFFAGGSVTLDSSSATGNQWYLNGNPIGGATNQQYVATASGDYTVTVTNGGCASASSAATTVTVNPSPDLAITKTDGVTTVHPGGSTTYTIIASNSGPGDATGATVADTFPAALTCTWTCSGANSGTCMAAGSGNINDVVNLPNGGSVTYVASCTISSAASGTLSNTATVSEPAGATDPVPGNNSATDSDSIVAQADIALTLDDHREHTEVGQSVNYIIDVTNTTGPNTVTATVTDALPTGLVNGSWVCIPFGGATCANGFGNTLTDTATLPVGGETAYVYSATVVTGDENDELVNTATAVVTSGTDPTPGNNTATDTDIVSIFIDGFEGTPVMRASDVGIGTDYVSATLRIDATLLNALTIMPTAVASGRGADGKILFTLELARFGNDVVLRAVTTDGHGYSERSAWQVIDVSQRLLAFAWQSASIGASNGYLKLDQTGDAPLLSGRNDPDRLTQLLVTIENATPWLVLITN
ncbi:MAG: carboxypeptidase regulatory-like domain-containing protein [Rudaea sp.]